VGASGHSLGAYGSSSFASCPSLILILILIPILILASLSLSGPSRAKLSEKLSEKLPVALRLPRRSFGARGRPHTVTGADWAHWFNPATGSGQPGK